jgi:hypothetical protein
MVEFIHGVVALLAGLILVLTALVGWLYLQQSRMNHAINALAVAVTAPPPSFMYSELPAGESHAEQAPLEPSADEDRLSVHDIDAPAEATADAPAEATAEAPVATVEDGGAGGAEDSADAVAGKTVSQLRDMLTAKGIPFNKSDKKPTLISLIQVSSPA